jgi:hypothetical protein
MSKLDLAIRGGTVVTASDTFRADVGVREGRIVAVAAEIKEAIREIDASGLLVLPGGIDSHVHIAQSSGPNVVMADDFASATAAAGANTCIMPFALQQRGTSLRRACSRPSPLITARSDTKAAKASLRRKAGRRFAGCRMAFRGSKRGCRSCFPKEFRQGEFR